MSKRRRAIYKEMENRSFIDHHWDFENANGGGNSNAEADERRNGNYLKRNVLPGVVQLVFVSNVHPSANKTMSKKVIWEGSERKRLPPSFTPTLYINSPSDALFPPFDKLYKPKSKFLFATLLSPSASPTNSTVFSPANHLLAHTTPFLTFPTLFMKSFKREGLENVGTGTSTQLESQLDKTNP
ncbi:hypothetical protein K435DRAFT_794737 [Dendrothele bispora CBS 962.96]|uniref:Uncharacterized protein n=1 Tax=Dendrothele bispora (strain CBS 962.96) TaxID=1314807 RepID=A0A4S8MB39_DENBC|nr:hypothetical protein K435DRAFT_794737 [Dendrothele bispora CBS 962.96]